ncbi:MAG: hypothetical protein Fur0041_16940 [Bacteroidia bacterium]
MKKKALLFVLLFLPAIIYIYFALGVPKIKRAPFFGPRKVQVVKDSKGVEKNDTVYYSIPAFRCVTREGISFDSKQTLDGRLYLAIFVQPDSLKEILPILADDIRINRKNYSFARFVFFWPEDSLRPCPDLATELGLGTDTAFSLIVPKATFDSLRDQHYFIPDPSRKKDPWQSKSDAVLIDRVGRIRGYFNIRYAVELKKMKEDVRHVMFRDEAVQTLEQSKVEQKK